MGILRFILAISVVIAHSNSILGFSFVGGQIAVQAFYIISGFYMTLILNEKYIGVNNSYKLFISNRFLRLFPIYWTILLLTLFASFFTSICTNAHNLGKLSMYVEYWDVMSFKSLFFLIFTNLFLFLQDIVLFLGLDTLNGELYFTSNFWQTTPQLHQFLFIPQAWTIGLEITFYLIAPFIVRKKNIVIITLIISSLFLRYILSHYGLSNDPWSYRFFPTELVFFLLGTLSYRIYKKIRSVEVKNSYLNIALFGILLFTIFYNFLPLLYKNVIYLFSFFICLPFIFLLTKKWRVDSFIGELSYPIYISHMFVLGCFTSLDISLGSYLGICLIISTVGLSILLNNVISQRIEKIRQTRIVITNIML